MCAPFCVLQGPDVYFQCVEAAQPFYDAVPDAVVAAMKDVTAITGRDYKPYDYVGHPQVCVPGGL